MIIRMDRKRQFKVVIAIRWIKWFSFGWLLRWLKNEEVWGGYDGL